MYRDYGIADDHDHDDDEGDEHDHGGEEEAFLTDGWGITSVVAYDLTPRWRLGFRFDYVDLDEHEHDDEHDDDDDHHDETVLPLHPKATDTTMTMITTRCRSSVFACRRWWCFVHLNLPKFGRNITTTIAVMMAMPYIRSGLA